LSSHDDKNKKLKKMFNQTNIKTVFLKIIKMSAKVFIICQPI